MPIYAKSSPKETLAEHTINDITVGRQLVTNLPFSDEMKQKIGSDLDMILAFHDVGKAASGFQKSLEKDAPYWGYRHEILSAVAAQSAGMRDEIVFSILFDHKTLPSNGDDDLPVHSYLNDDHLPYGDHVYEAWDIMSSEWYENLEELKKEWNKICEFLHLDSSSLMLSLDTHLSAEMVNWIYRDTQPEHFSFEQREYMSLLRGLTITADHIASAGHTTVMGIPDLNKCRLDLPEPYAFQTRTGNRNGNLILQSPTGSGKTKAAFLWARKNKKDNGRFFYTLPITASLHAMWRCFVDIFEDNKHELVGLLHSRVASSIYAMLDGDGIDKQSKSWDLSSLAREMYFPIRLCTPHQVLKFTLFGRGWEMMLSEFPNSVFVFDEVHAYNPRHMGLTMATATEILELYS